MWRDPFAHTSQNWLVRSASEVEQNIVSVERILHYVELPPEAPNELPDTKPADVWPSQGQVEFRYVLIWPLICGFTEVSSPNSQYSCRYRPELSLVLKDVSMTIVRSEYVAVLFCWYVIYVETPRKNWYMWQDWSWEIFGMFYEFIQCVMALTWILVVVGPLSYHRTYKRDDTNWRRRHYQDRIIWP